MILLDFSAVMHQCIFSAISTIKPKEVDGQYETKEFIQYTKYRILEEISNRLPGFPIVLHGASSVMPEYVEMVNSNGGEMPDAIGVPEDLLRQAASMAVCKINIDSDLRLAMTGVIRKHFNEHPDHFDPRQYLGDARAAIKDVVKHKIENVLGSKDKA